MTNKSDKNPLDVLGIRREHIIAIKQAHTHTNKQASTTRAQYLWEVFQVFEKYDRYRDGLYWDDVSESVI